MKRRSNHFSEVLATALAGAVFWGLLAAPAALAQRESASLRGVVRDANGSKVSGALVTITGMDTAITREITTDSDGSYSASFLAPGRYKVTVQQRGYELYAVDEVTLSPGQTRLLDATTGASVPDDKPPAHLVDLPVHPEGGAVTGTVDYANRWPDAPVVEKTPSPLPLLVTAPGIQGNGRGLVMEGISDRNRQTWAVDGVPDDSGATPVLHPEFFDTAEVLVVNPGVESYRATGYDVVTKRGGSTFHGQAYGKRGSAVFDARPYFGQKSNYSLQEEGGDLSAQLIPNLTFFSGGGVLQRNPYQQTLFADVPTTQMRIRDFSQYLDPATSPTGAVLLIRDPRTGQPFPGNQIPSSRLNTVANNTLNNNYIPSPNAGGNNTVSQNYTWQHPFGPDLYRGVWPFLRLDQNLGTGHRLYFRWLDPRTSTIAPGSLGPLLDSTQATKYQSFAFSESSTLAENLVNRINVARATNRVLQGEAEGKINPARGDTVVSNLGIQGTNLYGTSTVGSPTIGINGLTGLAMTYAGGATGNVAQDDHTFTLDDGVVWSKGNHSVKAGVQYTHFDWLLGAVPQNIYGSFTFSGMFTGLGFADFLLGYPATSSRLQGAKLNDQIHQDQVGLYLADNFRVSPRLTLDYGLRWDRFGSPVYRDGFMYNWDPATGNVVVAPGTITSVSTLYPKNIRVVAGTVVPKPNNRNFRPRVGAAYRLRENLVVRAGYGEFTDGGGFGSSGRINDPNGPYRIEETYYNALSGTTPLYTFPKPFPASTSAALTGVQNITAQPFTTDEGIIHQYHATIERAIGSLGLRASYIGARGTGMNYSLDVNKPQASAIPFSTARLPYPQFGSVFATRADGSWHYNSAQFAARKRAGGVVFDSSFTLGSNFSNYANTFDPYHVTDKWTRDGADRRLYFVASAQWTIPVGKGQRFFGDAGPIANRLIRDWTFQATVTAASGQYYSPLFTGPDPANASRGFVTALPDCTGDPSSGAGTVSRWFNPSAFSIPGATAGRYGTCGMNTLESYPIHVGHVSLAKRIPLGEFVSAVFAVQVSNVTNTPHFTIPQNNLSNAGAGGFLASSAVLPSSPERQGSRQLDIKLRLQW